MPSISNVTWYSSAQQIVVSGNGFGSHVPYNGDSAFIKLVDLSENNYEEGYTGDPYGLNISSWTDNQIAISGWTASVFFQVMSNSGTFPLATPPATSLN
jgi:hypothetical protein